MGDDQGIVTITTHRSRPSHQYRSTGGSERDAVHCENGVSIGEPAVSFSECAKYLLSLSQMVFGWNVGTDQPGFGLCGAAASGPQSASECGHHG